MRNNLRGTVWRLAVFLSACAAGTFALLLVFAQFRFQDERTYNADFSSVSGLKVGDFVRIAGVEVGKVKRVSILNKVGAQVEFSADDTVVLTEGTQAAVRYDNLVGDRYVELLEGAGGVRPLTPGQTIPLDHTSPALDLDSLIGGFRPLFRALDPDQVNTLTNQLVQAFQGQGDTIGSFLAQTASVTSTLADRDQLIGQVITNLNVVLGSLGNQTKQFDKAVDAVSELVHGLAQRKTDITNAVAHTNAAAASIADLLSQIRPSVKNVVTQTDRAAGIVVADKDYLDNLLNILPDAYTALSRQAIYGDYFSFYLCDALLKVNGKGGQPVYVKLVEQSTGRCTPK
jgi:phospholipid/cholesterol/gamma-HCH transport system substrate-binding protein